VSAVSADTPCPPCHLRQPSPNRSGPSSPAADDGTSGCVITQNGQASISPKLCYKLPELVGGRGRGLSVNRVTAKFRKAFILSRLEERPQLTRYLLSQQPCNTVFLEYTGMARPPVERIDNAYFDGLARPRRMAGTFENAMSFVAMGCEPRTMQQNGDNVEFRA
jgi:hypothetical protein